MIRLLSSDVVDQIAAGEVLERPASAVKELMENAVDAGAKHVDVFLEGGGLTSITVVDDGVGMSPDDVDLCVQRHATSKLRCLDDLLRINTHGFRGEALSSMAQVARLTITSRRVEDPAATRLCMRGGEVIERALVGAPVGTCMRVDELYFNTPARRKFMASPATEQARCLDAAMRVLLSASSAGGSINAGARRLLHVPWDITADARVRLLLGARVKDLHGFDAQNDGVRVHGFLSPPEVDRGDSKGIWWFVNGRSVRDRTLQRALADAYVGHMGPGRYPVAVIFVELSGEAVDVNVHPQKSEVRFRDPKSIYRAVSAAIAQALLDSPKLLAGAGGGVVQALARFEHTVGAQLAAPAGRACPAPTERISEQPPLQPTLPRIISQPSEPPIRVLGDAVDGVFVCRQGDTYWMIHGELLASRMLHTSLQAAATRGKIPRRRLLVPLMLTLDAAAAEMIHALVGWGVVLTQAGSQYALTELAEGADPVNWAAVVHELCALAQTQDGTHGFVVSDAVIDVFAKAQRPIRTADALLDVVGRHGERIAKACELGAAKVIVF